MASSTSPAPGNLVHTLIARHPRTSMTHASLSHPAETHAAAAGVFPRPQPNHLAAGTAPPTWNEDPSQGPNGASSLGGHARSASLTLSDLEAMEFASPEGDGSSDESSREPIEVDETFTKDARWPGSVRIHVEATTFWSVNIAMSLACLSVNPHRRSSI